MGVGGYNETSVNLLACQEDEEFLDIFRTDSVLADSELAQVLSAWSMDVHRDPWPVIDLSSALAAIEAGKRPVMRKDRLVVLVGLMGRSSWLGL